MYKRDTLFLHRPTFKNLTQRIDHFMLKRKHFKENVKQNRNRFVYISTITVGLIPSYIGIEVPVMVLPNLRKLANASLILGKQN